MNLFSSFASINLTRKDPLMNEFDRRRCFSVGHLVRVKRLVYKFSGRSRFDFVLRVRDLDFRQLCDLGFLSLLSTESTDQSSDSIPLFQSDMIDNGLVNFTFFLNYIRKHVDRLTIRAGNISYQRYCQLTRLII